MRNGMFRGVICLLIISSCNTPNTEFKTPGSSQTTLVKQGVADQKISPEWMEALRTREPDFYLDSLQQVSRPLSDQEQGWKLLIASVAEEWNSMRDSLMIPFGEIGISDTIYILLGYQGMDDGFTYKDRTICLDLTALFTNYGSAQHEENRMRIMRLISHEYTHLLSKKWMEKNNFRVPENHMDSDTAFRKHILWEMWYEGFGTYRSMSEKWFPVGDSISVASMKVLEKLEPVFVEKIITMDTTTMLSADQKIWIQTNVSDGPFTEKYAALPVGIWLALEAGGDDRNLVKWVNNGPEGILRLAEKYLRGENKRTFTEVFGDRFDEEQGRQ